MYDYYCPFPIGILLHVRSFLSWIGVSLHFEALATCWRQLIFHSICFQAFVHDPLINWRLFNFNEVPQMSTPTSMHVPPVVDSEESASNRELLQPQRGARERELLQVWPCVRASCTYLRSLLGDFCLLSFFYFYFYFCVGCSSTRWREWGFEWAGCGGNGSNEQ